MKKIGVGIIGAGRMGDRHVEAYSKIDEARLIGIVDVIPEKAKKLAKKYGVKWFKDIEHLLANPKLDAVNICTSSASHTEPSILAMEAGKHILVEKPLALTLNDCNKIISAAEKTGVFLMVGQTHRFYPSNIAVKKEIDSESIGNAFMASDFCMNPGFLPGKPRMPDWARIRAMGGGVFMLDAVHTVDRLRWWLNSDVDAVYTVGMGRNVCKTEGETEDSGVVAIQFKNKSYATITHISPSHGIYDNVTKIIGTKGVIHLVFGSEVKVGRQKWRRVPFLFQSSPPSYSHVLQGFINELTEFVNSILEDQQPSVTGKDGRAAVEIVLAIYKSAETGTSVNLPISD